MRKLLLSLLLITLLQGCVQKITSPHFPIPSEPLKERLDLSAQTDRDLYVWLNRLRILCIQLGDCE